MTRIMWGARTAAIVAVIATTMSLTLGIILGSLGAYIGGWMDTILSRMIDVTLSIPQLLFASLIAATFRKPVADWVDALYKQTGLSIFATTTYADLIVVFGALAFIAWPGYARLIRARFIFTGKGVCRGGCNGRRQAIKDSDEIPDSQCLGTDYRRPDLQLRRGHCG